MDPMRSDASGGLDERCRRAIVLGDQAAEPKVLRFSAACRFLMSGVEQLGPLP